jgi:hypothetical protein
VTVTPTIKPTGAGPGQPGAPISAPATIVVPPPPAATTPAVTQPVLGPSAGPPPGT